MPAVSAGEASIPQAIERAAPGDIVYFDGRYVPKGEVRVSPDDRGFLLGDGIYEVAAAYDGRFVALDRHMDRLRRSLRESRIGDSIADPLETVFQELLERNGFGDSGKSMVYMQVTRGAAPRSHAFPKIACRPTVYAYAAPFPDMGNLSAGTAAITRPDLRWSDAPGRSGQPSPAGPPSPPPGTGSVEGSERLRR